MFMIDLLIDKNNWSLNDILTLLSIFLGIIGGIFAYQQWRYANKTKRAEFINQIINKLRFDDEFANTMSVIDYNLTWYDENFHENVNGLECKVDKVFSYLSYICYLRNGNHISKKEFSALEYEINRACISPSSQSYFWNLFHFSKKCNAKCSFQSLIDYGIKNALIDEAEFMNPKSKQYIKRLNF